MAIAHGRHSAAEDGISVSRRGVASLLFALTRPADAKTSALDGGLLRRKLPIGSREIAFGEIETVELQTRWRWGGLLTRSPSGDSAASGLSRRDATALAGALEDARKRWWRDALAAGVLTQVPRRRRSEGSFFEDQ